MKTKRKKTDLDALDAERKELMESLVEIDSSESERIDFARWEAKFEFKEKMRKLETELIKYCDHAMSRTEKGDKGDDVPGYWIAWVRGKIRLGVQTACGGLVRAPVCPRCDNLPQQPSERTFDAARLKFIESSVDRLERLPDGKWIARAEGRESVGRSPREAIDNAAKATDETLRPSGPVRFKAYVRRFRR
jgi:hypothetical protein